MLGMCSFYMLVAGVSVQARTVEAPLDSVFQLSADQLRDDRIYFDYSLAPIANWSPERRQALSVADGYRPLETMLPLGGGEGLEVYESQLFMVVDRPVADLNLEQIDTVAFIQSFDPDLSHRYLDPARANEIYQSGIQEDLAYQVGILDRKRAQAEISQADYERALAVLNQQAEVNRSRIWCQDGSECIHSTAPFPMDWQLIIQSARATGQVDEDFPLQIEFSSEVIRGTPAELAGLPEVNGLVEGVLFPARYVLIESSFRFNRFIQGGKTLISLHELPNGKTLVVIFAAIFVEADALTKYDMLNFRIRDVLEGNSFFVNRDQGFAKGLPPYNVDLATELRARLEEL